MSDQENGNGSGESSDEDFQENQKVYDSKKQRSLKCVICDKLYKSLRSWKQHMQETHMRKRQCEFCDKSFSRVGNLRLHEYKHHGRVKGERKQKSMQFKCDTCFKIFNRKYNLIRHCSRVHDHAAQKKR